MLKPIINTSKDGGLGYPCVRPSGGEDATVSQSEETEGEKQEGDMNERVSWPPRLTNISDIHKMSRMDIDLQFCS